jgi:hypothetical protein
VAVDCLDTDLRSGPLDEDTRSTAEERRWGRRSGVAILCGWAVRLTARWTPFAFSREPPIVIISSPSPSIRGKASGTAAMASPDNSARDAIPAAEWNWASFPIKGVRSKETLTAQSRRSVSRNCSDRPCFTTLDDAGVAPLHHELAASGPPRSHLSLGWRPAGPLQNGRTAAVRDARLSDRPSQICVARSPGSRNNAQRSNVRALCWARVAVGCGMLGCQCTATFRAAPQLVFLPEHLRLNHHASPPLPATTPA